MIYDVVVVGSGPGGSAAASFLARRGASTLLLDKSSFPRDKVCGDGLTPQAIYWLDQLGCVDEVLAQTNGCIKTCDLYIDHEQLLTGRFPSGTVYPDFAVLLDRRRFDNTVRENAMHHGAHFLGEQNVRGVEYERDCAVVVAESGRKRVEHRGRIVIGADGVSSAISRAVGNTLKDGAMAVSLRAYYRDVHVTGSQIRVYFDRDYFPGYGWLFVDDDGFANVGLGYAIDRAFEMSGNLATTFRRFVREDLGDVVDERKRCGPVSGGSAGFFKHREIVANRIMLIGDAANQADPLNGGGIHKAMESAWCAAEAAQRALDSGDTTRQGLATYETLWARQFDMDWRTGEIFLSIAKNPDLKDFCIFLLTQIGRLTNGDPRFQDFCSGVFSGVIAQSTLLSPIALYHAFPKDVAAWRHWLDEAGGPALGTFRVARGLLESLSLAGGRMARRPLTTADWSLEVAAKLTRLAERQLATQPRERAA